jgi:hypothetical protein
LFAAALDARFDLLGLVERNYKQMLAFSNYNHNEF